VDFCCGIVAGMQYYFSKTSRHSFKFAIDYSNYNIPVLNGLTNQYYSYNEKDISIGCRYEYDFVRTSKFDAFLLMHILDMSYYSETDPAEKGVELRPRFSPGIGFEVKPARHLALYAEMDNLLQFSCIPNSFSVGLKYDLCSSNW
jgi:hypothetical protein